jgi:hypothetical protein
VWDKTVSFSGATPRTFLASSQIVDGARSGYGDASNLSSATERFSREGVLDPGDCCQAGAGAAERAHGGRPGARPETRPHRWAPAGVTDRARVAELRAAGKSLGEIAAEMGLAKTTVARIAQESAA